MGPFSPTGLLPPRPGVETAEKSWRWPPIGFWQHGTRLALPPYGAGGCHVVVWKRPMVLVVEDDEEMRNLLFEELWTEGYQLREARDGDEAFMALLQTMPDLIITDLRLPSGGLEYGEPPAKVCAGLPDHRDDGIRGRTGQSRGRQSRRDGLHQ
jgi:CheY-like chemotaxis protein